MEKRDTQSNTEADAGKWDRQVNGPIISSYLQSDDEPDPALELEN